MTKRMLSFLLVLVLVIGMIPVTHVHAENIEETVTEQTAAPTEEETTWETEPAVQAEVLEVLPIAGETNLADLDLPDSDELFAGFVEKQFYEQILSENSIPATFGTAAGARLTGNDKIVYDAFASVFQQLADGTRTDATISLGQTVLHDGVTYVPDVEATFTGMTINLRNIIVALITDLPYECYWFDKTSGWKPFGLTSGDDCVYYQVSFSVTEAYQGDDSYTTDASKTGAASAAAANAEAVVAKYEKESDYHKLLAYQNWICEAVSYDHSAASSGSYALNNNPWQLIYVFDGNADTNVVCEGYAKAFMYLCDLSDFTGDVTCVTVSGNAGGAHMWNIVALNNENYLVDVTNSDAGSIGQNGDLFLVGTSGSILDGYTFLGVHYSYDNDTRKLWSAADDSILKLAAEDYVKELVEEDTIPEGLVYEVVDNAVKITDYTGTASDLVIPATIEGYPVIAIGSEAFSRCDSLVSVTVPESITAIYMQAFAYCSKLEEITLPDTLTKLGALAFYECVNLTKVNLPANLTEIQKSVFCGCSSLNSIIVPSGVTQILDGAFMYSGLDYVVIPATVESIGKLAFENTNLWHILYEGTQAQWNSISADVQDELSNATIHCNISSNQIIEVNTLNCQGKVLHHCQVCDERFYDSAYTGKVGDHEYVGYVTEPSCTAKGYTTYICHCGEQYVDDYVDMLDHEFGSWYVENDPTCTENGNERRDCDDCDAFETRVIKANGHQYSHSVTKPTCTEEGYTTHTCDICGYAYADTYVDFLGHTGGKATCKDKAICTRCEKPYGELDGSNHAGGTEIRNAKDATCTLNGYTGDTHCKGCGSMFISGQTIPFKGHTEEGIPGKAATCTESGLTDGKKCTVCGVVTVKQEVIQAKGHTYTSEVVAPTYTQQGYTEHTCSACGHSYKDSYTAVFVLPKKITIKASTSSKTGKPVVSWTKLEGDVTYKVYRATSSKGKYYLKGTVTGDSFEDTSASVGKKYYYKVKATAGGKTTDYSSYKSATCKLAAPVISASVSKYSGKVKISWKKVSSAKKYEVYRATSTGSFKKLTTTSSTSYTDSSASVGTSYRYKVKAVASKSTYNSSYSAILAAKRICAQPDLEVKISTTYGKPSLSWDKVSGAKSYNIYRAESQYGEYTLVRTTTSTSWTDKTAAFDKDYWYQVDVVGSKTGTDNDTDAAVKVHTTCAKPSVSITISSKKPKVSWKPVEGATKYYVYRATSKSGKYTKVATVTDATSYRDSKAKKGKTYYYKVKAVATNSAANSAYSSVKSIKSK